MSIETQQPRDFVETLQDYLTLAPHLLPRESSQPLNQPTLRHPDLTPTNVFMDPATCRVTCLIDWQHATIQPRLLVAGAPPICDNPNPMKSVPAKPTLPEVSALSEGEQTEARELYRSRLLYYYYRTFTFAFNKPHHEALIDPMLRFRQLLVDYAGRPWTGNKFTLRGAVNRTVQQWHRFPDTAGIPCPVHLDQAELEEFLKNEENWNAATIISEYWRQRVCNMNEEGWVRVEEYERATAELRKLEHDVWAMCEGDQDDEQAFKASWPFRDHDEQG